MTSLATWLGVHLQTKWLWVRAPLQSLKQITIFTKSSILDVSQSYDYAYETIAILGVTDTQQSLRENLARKFRRIIFFLKLLTR